MLLMQAFAGIVTVSVGHCHPKVLKAIEDQNKLLQHTTTIYLNPQVAQYAQELTDRMPGNLKVGSQPVAVFCNMAWMPQDGLHRVITWMAHS